MCYVRPLQCPSGQGREAASVGERTRLGLGVLGVALVLGGLGDLLLRATPWGINFLIWVTVIVGLATLLARWGRVGTGERGSGWSSSLSSSPRVWSCAILPLWYSWISLASWSRSPLLFGSDAAGASGALASWTTFSGGSIPEP